MTRHFWLYAVCLVFLGCTSVADEFSDLIDLDFDDPSEHRVEPASMEAGILALKAAGDQASAEWFDCSIKSNDYFVLISASGRPFSKKSVCYTEPAQAFLQSKIGVLAINLPGIGASPGTFDLGGAQSVAAIRQVVQARMKGQRVLKGLWGYGETSIAGMVYSRHNPKVPALIVGSGVFDLDALKTQSSDPALKKRIEDLWKRSGESAMEARSVAWDPVGMPSKVYLYHGEKDRRIPSQGSLSFRDSLQTQGFDSRLILVPDQKHLFKPGAELATVRKILEDRFLKKAD